MIRARWFLTLPCLAVTLTGCGGGSDDAAMDSGAASAEAEEHPTDRALHAHVVLTGGKYAGTYDRTEPEGMCAAGGAGMTGASLGFPYTEPSTQPGTVQNVSLGAHEASAAGNDKFGFVVSVTGPDSIPHEIRIDPPKGVGSGTAVVTGTFPVYTARIQGTTADGVKVDATLECAKSG